MKIGPEYARHLASLNDTRDRHYGSLYGVRGWNIGYQYEDPRCKMLTGVRAPWSTPWRTGELLAHCGKMLVHQAPSFNCSCGIYSYEDARSWLNGDYSSMKVWGIIELAGRVIRHERGYRSERAKVVALFLNTDELIPHFGFPAQKYRNFQAMCQEFGLLTD